MSDSSNKPSPDSTGDRPGVLIQRRTVRFIGLVVGLLLGLLFLAAAVVQYNDPDPLRWQAMYLGSTVACVVYGLLIFGNQGPIPAWGRVGRAIGFLVIAAAVVWMITLIPALRSEGWVSQTQFGTEPARELGGLAFVAAVNMAGLVLTRLQAK